MAAAGPLPAGSVRLTLAEGSEARYKAREQVAGRSAPSDAIGATRDVARQVVLGPDGAILATASRITVDLRTLTSDRPQRDSFIKRNPLQTDQFPTVEFVPREARGLPAPLPTSGDATFELLGDLTIHGVSRPATWQVAAQLTAQQVEGLASTTVQLPEFGMQKPRVASILSIEDDITLEIAFRATRAR